MLDDLEEEETNQIFSELMSALNDDDRRILFADEKIPLHFRNEAIKDLAQHAGVIAVSSLISDFMQKRTKRESPSIITRSLDDVSHMLWDLIKIRHPWVSVSYEELLRNIARSVPRFAGSSIIPDYDKFKLDLAIVETILYIQSNDDNDFELAIRAILDVISMQRRLIIRERISLHKDQPGYVHAVFNLINSVFRYDVGAINDALEECIDSAANGSAALISSLTNILVTGFIDSEGKRRDLLVYSTCAKYGDFLRINKDEIEDIIDSGIASTESLLLRNLNDDGRLYVAQSAVIESVISSSTIGLFAFEAYLDVAMVKAFWSMFDLMSDGQIPRSVRLPLVSPDSLY